MEIAERSDYSSFRQFIKRILDNKLKIEIEDLSISYTNSEGNKLDFTYPDRRFLNGEMFNIYSSKIFEGPFVNSSNEGRLIEISYNEQKLILDFKQGGFKILN